MKKVVANITINNKKYNYSLEEKKHGLIFVECKDANIAQEFLAEDVPSLLIDLPNLIVAEKEYEKKQSEVIRFRISSVDKNKIEKKAVKEGYDSISDYMRHLASINNDIKQPGTGHTNAVDFNLDISNKKSSAEREIFMDKCKPSPYYSKMLNSKVHYSLS
jgi:predicted DNA binding CopG/RHH family protein